MARLLLDVCAVLVSRPELLAVRNQASHERLLLEVQEVPHGKQVNTRTHGGNHDEASNELYVGPIDGKD